ncbi:SGT1 protein-domain-containing protein [Podospora australis]|uniref:SGT1 protein-domain-containing protein n=1 Tax=Podospora australis TaxID=1536484 RepID=A0AAN6WPE9_9PEZI|nr:SGT1 protein-domain-containing protein [Podospora australis]
MTTNADQEPRPGDEGFDGFRMRLPEDCVEYMLFVIGDKTTGGGLPNLETVRKAADRKLDELAKDYIWQREPFRLETRIQKGSGLSYLHGTTHYGDNVEDEWFIVYLLRELSKTFPNLWIRVSDSDGEFLLIEAAKVLPKWLSPENDANRVWIHQGKLLIVPLEEQQPTSKNNILSLTSALSTIKTSPSRLLHSPFIEAESFYRLEKYPAQISSSDHYSLVTLPRKLAYILHARPQSIAPATESFYLRDPSSLKPLVSPTTSNFVFQPADLVTISVRFTKVLYAQLKSQHFSPPSAWKTLIDSAEIKVSTSPDSEDTLKEFGRLEMGMKVTTGFEILARASDRHSNRVVREIGILLEDLAEDGDENVLPTDKEIATWEGVDRNDDDGWMDIDYAEFERELDGKDKGKLSNKKGFGDANTQADLQKIVERFEAFLNDEGAGIEGAVLEDDMDHDDDDDHGSDDSDDDEVNAEDWEDEDKEVGFDEEQFANMMREMMGLPGDGGDAQTQDKDKGKEKAVDMRKDDEEGEDKDEGEDASIQKLMQQFESELKGLGALDLDPKPKTVGRIVSGAAQSGRESKAGRDEGEEEEEEDDDDDGEDGDEGVDIDYNLAKNLLESFKSQAGMAGPAGNLLGLMNIQLPRDEEDSDDNEGRDGKQS